jgi:predicted aspartyl protease
MPTFSSDYDNQNYNPAAPVVEIGIAKSGQQTASTRVKALIDSGADATMLPINLLQEVNARYSITRQMRGVGDHPIVVEMYVVTLFVGEFAFPGVEVIAANENSESLIGRDVLNQMIVTLNGLANVIEMTQ